MSCFYLNIRKSWISFICQKRNKWCINILYFYLSFDLSLQKEFYCIPIYMPFHSYPFYQSFSHCCLMSRQKNSISFFPFLTYICRYLLFPFYLILLSFFSSFLAFCLSSFIPFFFIPLQLPYFWSLSPDSKPLSHYHYKSLQNIKNIG